MITMKDPSLTVFPNREQMLALIQARAAANANRADEKASADPVLPPSPACVFHLED